MGQRGVSWMPLFPVSVQDRAVALSLSAICAFCSGELPIPELDRSVPVRFSRLVPMHVRRLIAGDGGAHPADTIAAVLRLEPSGLTTSTSRHHRMQAAAVL